MAHRTPSYENLAMWDDFNITNPVEDDEDDLTYIDPRETPVEIVELDRTVVNLEAELTRLRLKRAQILADQSLVSRIPPELLSRVFELGVHEQLTLLPTLSLVSRHWRNLALTTPSLWSHIRLDHNWGYGRTASFLQKLTTHLERSQACKLQVNVDFRFLDVFPDVLTVMTQLEPHLERCFHFHVSVPDWDWMAAVREKSHGLGPCLEELYLRIDPSDSEDQTPIIFLQTQCPRLHTIVLEHTPLTCIRPSSPTTPLCLPALRKLHLIRDQRYHSSARIGISFKELLDTVSCTPSLVELRIQSAVFLLDGTEPIFHPNPTLTTIPLLTSLSFNFLDTTNTALLLDSLSLPSLHRLAIQMEPNNEETTHWLSRLSAPSPSSPFEFRFPDLRHLDLRACNIDGPALFPFIRALHSLPHLTALALSSPPSGTLGSKLFDLLSSPSPSPASSIIPTSPTDAALPSPSSLTTSLAGVWVLPNLCAFCVQNCRDISGHELLRLVRARQNHVGEVKALRYLRISQCYSVDTEVVDTLKSLVDVVVTS